MAVDVTMPQMGADMTEGTLVKWIKQVGDEVKRGETIAEIETDKATVELEAFESGTLLKHVVEEGETVPVGDVIAILGAAGEVPAEAERKPPAETPPRRTPEPAPVAQGAPPAAANEAPDAAPYSPEVAPPPAPEAERMHERIDPGADGHRLPAEDTGVRIRISPVARRIASEAGLDIRNLQGSGPDGRILRRDVESAMRSGAPAAVAPPTAAPAPARPAAAAGPPARPAAAAPAPAPASGVQPLSRMRQAIARRMAQSKQTHPHYYLTLDIDMTDAMAFRKQINDAASEEQRVSVNDLVVKACAIALQRHPKFNAAYTEQGLQYHDYINIDIGIALDEGLIAASILDVGNKSLGTIAAESKDLIERVKGGGIRSDELGAGTFTITNLGAYGVETLIGIINPPQAAILGVGSVLPQPAVRDDQVVARQLMKVALSADHRVTDGAEGARFIKEIQGILENPISLAL
ncbi:MAG TPA: dihydrolipoamide acetyltransferase family protein [Tepidiformaceae bacterium]|nr:dihydrolipoamide acetyltransferase family protein [Tepidiformaceae bacterium]